MKKLRLNLVRRKAELLIKISFINFKRIYEGAFVNLFELDSRKRILFAKFDSPTLNRILPLALAEYTRIFREEATHAPLGGCPEYYTVRLFDSQL